MPHKPASKAYRDQQRERLVRLGVDGHERLNADPSSSEAASPPDGRPDDTAIWPV